MSEMNIPVVDLHDLSSPHGAAQRRAAEALTLGFGHYGLVYIKNHDIDPAELDTFYDAFLEFTGRDTAEKETLSRPDIWFQRGWTPPNTEKAVVAGEPDFKECYFAAPEPMDSVAAMQYPQVYADNIWPNDSESFRENYLDIGHQLHEIGLALLRGCARALGLEPYRFEAAVYGGPHVTRALRYIPLDETQVNRDDILWGEEHTDFNLLTLLPGGRFFDPSGARCPKPDARGGLYLRTRSTPEYPNGQMVQGTPPEGCIVSQVGQQLEILTGGTYLATPHVIKAPSLPGYSRTSMAHFIHLHAHQTLFPLEPFRTPQNIEAYSPPVLAGTYGLKTLVDIGLAPADTLNQLGYRHYDRLASIRASE